MTENETHEQGPDEAANQAAAAADGTGPNRGWRPSGHPTEQPTTERPTAEQPVTEPAPTGESQVEQPVAGAEPTMATAQFPVYPPASDPYAPPSGAPATGAPYAGYPGPYQGVEGAPVSYPTANYPAYGGPTQPQRSGTGRKVGLAALIVAVAIGSGATSAFITHHYDHADTVATSADGTSRDTAPIIDRSSLASIAAAVRPSVVSIVTSNAEGSGVIISADGYILTNNHVAVTAQGQSVDITFSDGTTTKAALVGTDPKTDLAVFKAQVPSGKKLTVAKFGDSSALRVGDTVLAIGSPLGLDSTVTAGIVSALNRTIDETSDSQPQNPFNQPGQSGSQPAATIAGAIQTDAAINPGNSGGALVNTNGEVVGINTAIATNGGSEGNIGVGFAIPSNRAKTVAQDIINGTKVSHPYIGIGVVTADGNAGAQVKSVTAGSPAETAGLKVGDLITAYAGQPVHTADDLINYVQAAAVNTPVALTVVRGGQTSTVTVTLGESK